MRAVLKNKVLVVFVVSILFFVACTNSSKQNNNTQSTIMVFAAASLTNVISEIVDSFEVKYNIKVRINLASSGTLARQIEQGGEPDVYLSANKKWVNYIDSLGFIKEHLIDEVAQNSLVLIVPKISQIPELTIDSSLNLGGIIGSGLLSIGDPKHVPAGKYAKQALNYYGFYKDVSSQILPAKDVRTALMVVEMNESPLGIVYSTDARSSDKVKVIGSFQKKSHKPIKYYSAVCNTKEATLLFYKYLNTKETKATWIKFGFIKH